MLKRLFRKEKPKLYLGCIAVMPRSDIKLHIDEWGIDGREDLDSTIRESLAEIFDLPPASEAITPGKNDLGLDIVVPKFQSGDLLDVTLGEFGFFLAWRPKIEIGARLFNLKSGKTTHTTTVVVKLSWKEYLSRLFTWRALLPLKPMFDSTDINNLLHRACLELLSKLKKVA